MYTGIIKGLGTVVSLDSKPGLVHFGVDFPARLLPQLEQGASVSVDGVCLTVVKQAGSVVYFDAMQETLETTTLGQLKIDGQVNLERSAVSGVEIGGHMLSGHVDGMAKIIAIDRPANNVVMTFETRAELSHYIFSKGFIAIDGASLTIVDAQPNKHTFNIWFIPETLRATNFSSKQVGDQVNLEIEFQTKVLVDTVGRLLPQLLAKSCSK